MRESIRWGGSFAVVLAVHAGAVGVALGWSEAAAPHSPAPAAVMVELAPLPVAPIATPNEAPPAPELSEVIPEPEPPPPVEMPPPVVAEVTLPEPEPPPPVDLKPPPPKPEVKPPERKPPQPRVAAPQTAPAEAPQPAAPAPGVPVVRSSNALPTWRGLLMSHFERHKRYPNEAQRARHQGVVHVRFTMDRQGRVLAARIERGANVPSLDQEGLDLLRRAQPLPPLPADQPGDTLELIVPIQFFLLR
jgi:protein TonB